MTNPNRVDNPFRNPDGRGDLGNGDYLQALVDARTKASVGGGRVALAGGCEIHFVADQPVPARDLGYNFGPQDF